MHYACTDHDHERLLPYDAFPILLQFGGHQAMTIKNMNGDTPLHLLCMNQIAQYETDENDVPKYFLEIFNALTVNNMKLLTIPNNRRKWPIDTIDEEDTKTRIFSLYGFTPAYVKQIGKDVRREISQSKAVTSVFKNQQGFDRFLMEKILRHAHMIQPPNKNASSSKSEPTTIKTIKSSQKAKSH
jgi:hypothetical protein